MPKGNMDWFCVIYLRNLWCLPLIKVGFIGRLETKEIIAQHCFSELSNLETPVRVVKGYA